jgi:hypothetical protein
MDEKKVITVEIAELKIVTDRLFRHLEEKGLKKIELSEDFYWQIPQKQLYDMKHEPASFTVGQLYDDLSEIRKTLDGKHNPISYQFVWLASILRAIGEKVVS